ncbi:uncharacterized protein LOC108604200 [Drosophila busckii]|uniref:uncharacterized protein LOC108604200 n=1 Tax=Drosophila busckii TaxID=30019 RepID=UPI00083EFC37|nr:uncharacterized protein LOC108604200 [Drosophila busckii]
MLRHKRNSSQSHKTQQSEHVKLLATLDALHQQQSQTKAQASPVQLLRQRLQFNQHLNQRVTFCLELYHKNIIKKLSELNLSNVYKLTKNVCQT